MRRNFWREYGIVKTAGCLLIAALWIPSMYSRQPQVVRADQGLNGHSVKLHVGDTLEITLAENASTGFRWLTEAESGHRVEEILRERTSVPEGAPDHPGKPGLRQFYFEALEPGSVDLELHYRRAWETKPPAQKFRIRITVVPN